MDDAYASAGMKKTALALRRLLGSDDAFSPIGYLDERLDQVIPYGVRVHVRTEEIVLSLPVVPWRLYREVKEGLDSLLPWKPPLLDRLVKHDFSGVDGMDRIPGTYAVKHVVCDPFLPVLMLDARYRRFLWGATAYAEEKGWYAECPYDALRPLSEVKNALPAKVFLEYGELVQEKRLEELFRAMIRIPH